MENNENLVTEDTRVSFFSHQSSQEVLLSETNYWLIIFNICIIPPQKNAENNVFKKIVFKIVYMLNYAPAYKVASILLTRLWGPNNYGSDVKEIHFILQFKCKRSKV